MSINQAYKTQEVKPYYFSDTRVEFEIPADRFYSSSIRVGNIGYYGVADKRYLDTTGIKSLIRAITIYDNTTVLTQLKNYGDWSVFKEKNNSNTVNRDMKNKLHNTANGYMVSYNDQPENRDIDYINILSTRYYNVHHYTTASENTSPKLFLDLEEEFDMLRQMGYIDTTLFKRFRVVIEFMPKSSDNIASEFDAGLKLMRPLLLIDEVVDMALVKEAMAQMPSTVVFTEVESDTVSVPASVIPGQQNVSLRVGNFDGKMVNELVIQKKPSVDVGTNVKKYCSIAMNGEILQVINNGSRLLPYTGISGHNQALGMLTEMFGDINLTMNEHTTGVAGFNGSVDLLRHTGDASFLGLMVGDRVEKMELQYTRAINDAHNERLRSAMTMNVYGMVDKVLELTPNGYVVGYN